MMQSPSETHKMLPEIMISKTDRDCLASTAIAALRSERAPAAATLLLSELGRATILSEGAPEGVVAVHSQVETRDNVTNARSKVILVYPGEERDDPHKLSVLTPLGAALIGLSEGDSIDWCTVTGDRRSVTVLKVVASS
jgi:regulator of nucleoside diphosphate kinase